MKKKLSKLQETQKQLELTLQRTNEKIEHLGRHTSALYEALTQLQDCFDEIRNTPAEEKIQYEKLKEIRQNWKQQADKIETDYRNAEKLDAGAAAAGIGLGVAVAAMGPTAAMGIATTFGVASTGTAISALSGAAATNAALAWLGGGALALGGGGMAAGQALLALAGPVGWALAGISLLGSGLFLIKSRNDKKKLEDIFTLIGKRDIDSYNLAIVELNERIKRIRDETGKIRNAIQNIKTFGTDYSMMSESQQYYLGSYVNLMGASTQLLINPILGLLPKYTEADYKEYVLYKINTGDSWPYYKYKDLVISLANLLYKIDIDQQDKKLLTGCFKANKFLLESMNLRKKDIDESILDVVDSAIYLKNVEENSPAYRKSSS